MTRAARTPTAHILSQYLWPDDAPTGVYAEQLGQALADAGMTVRLVGGEGSYRPAARAPPRIPIERVRHFEGVRGRLASTAREYQAVCRAFAGYLRRAVVPGDVVIVTSAPPTTLVLHRVIVRRAAISIYWLQDYYPELLRGLWDAPALVRHAVAGMWNEELRRWNHVVKAAGNLGYSGDNATVIRNWPTLDLGRPQPCVPRTALYSGNLGHGHDVASFLRLCGRLRDEGFHVTVRGDGPGMSKLPSWITAAAPFADRSELIRSLWAAELHLIAGHPRFPEAVFPSKFWNAHATGRPVLASGFSGVMADELERARACDPTSHLPAWVRLVREAVH